MGSSTGKQNTAEANDTGREGCLSPVYEPRHDKANNVAVRPAKTQISLGIRPV